MTRPSLAQHRAMHRLWNLAEVPDRADRLALTGAIVGRELGSSNELTGAEARAVIDYLSGLDRAGDLAARARRFLDQHRPAPGPEPVPVDGGAFALFDVEPPPPTRQRWDL